MKDKKILDFSFAEICCFPKWRHMNFSCNVWNDSLNEILHDLNPCILECFDSLIPTNLHVFLCRVPSKSTDQNQSPPGTSQVALSFTCIQDHTYPPTLLQKGAQISQGSLSLQQGDCLILLLYSFFYLSGNEKGRPLSPMMNLLQGIKGKINGDGCTEVSSVYVQGESSRNEIEIFSKHSAQHSSVKC